MTEERGKGGRPGGDRSGGPGGTAAPARSRVEVRPLRPSDLPAVLRIERETFPVPWSERTFRNLLERPDAVLLVAVEGGAGAGPERPPVEGTVTEGGQAGDAQGGGARLLGYAVLWRAGEEAELGDLAVGRESRRRGIGRRLVARILEEAGRLGARGVFLEVRESNVPARRLYGTLGFRVVGRRPGYYARPPEDALVMRRSV